MRLPNSNRCAEELVAYKAALISKLVTQQSKQDAEIKVGSTFEVTSATDIDLTNSSYNYLWQWSGI